jgi:hypothetical protein
MRKLIIIFFITLSTQLYAQTKQIRGQVIHGKDSSALAFAKVELINYISKGNWTIVDSTRTDMKGLYYIKAELVSTGQYVIRVNETATFKVDLRKPEKKGYLDLPKFYYKKE